MNSSVSCASANDWGVKVGYIYTDTGRPETRKDTY